MNLLVVLSYIARHGWTEEWTIFCIYTFGTADIAKLVLRQVSVVLVQTPVIFSLQEVLSIAADSDTY